MPTYWKALPDLASRIYSQYGYWPLGLALAVLVGLLLLSIIAGRRRKTRERRRSLARSRRREIARLRKRASDRGWK